MFSLRHVANMTSLLSAKFICLFNVECWKNTMWALWISIPLNIYLLFVMSDYSLWIKIWHHCFRLGTHSSYQKRSAGPMVTIFKWITVPLSALHLEAFCSDSSLYIYSLERNTTLYYKKSKSPLLMDVSLQGPEDLKQMEM